jgi:hypothetical protein
MLQEDREKLTKVCTTIMMNCDEDAHAIDGLAFNGKNVAKLLGEHLAMIQAIAAVCKRILEG